MDSGGADAARKFIEKAEARHPSLIDEHHLLAETLGVVNVPSGIWVDEDGVLVRPPEPAFPGKSVFAEMVAGVEGELGSDNYAMHSLAVSKQIKRPDPQGYLDALRDWARNGGASRYALTPEQVVERSRPRGADDARAAAHFEMAEHLRRLGDEQAAQEHYREAHRLAPRNWTYKRQAWSFVDPLQNAGEVLGGDWANDVLASDPSTYYEQVGPTLDP